MKHGIIGYGNLAKAIHKILIKSGADEIYIYSPSRREKGEVCEDSAVVLASKADVIWLTVKPQNLDTLLSSLKEVNFSGRLIVSPIAGKSIGQIQSGLEQECAVLRIMPNLAFEYGSSVTAVAKSGINLPHQEDVLGIISLGGKTIALGEEHFALFTAIFGSGPAFLLNLIDVQKTKIMELGLGEEEVNTMLAGLLYGTAQYFSNNCNNETIGELISRIASKGGTTEAGLNYLKDNNIDKHFDNVINMAARRGVELGNAKNY
jgi:pyrroline-5-carboxylate reductase